MLLVEMPIGAMYEDDTPCCLVGLALAHEADGMGEAHVGEPYAVGLASGSLARRDCRIKKPVIIVALAHIGRAAPNDVVHREGIRKEIDRSHFGMVDEEREAGHIVNDRDGSHGEIAKMISLVGIDGDHAEGGACHIIGRIGRDASPKVVLDISAVVAMRMRYYDTHAVGGMKPGKSPDLLQWSPCFDAELLTIGGSKDVGIAEGIAVHYGKLHCQSNLNGLSCGASSTTGADSVVSVGCCCISPVWESTTITSLA